MMRRLGLVLAVLAAGFVTLAATPDPAFVLNAGRDDAVCSVSDGGPPLGIGNLTIVINDGGNVLVSCHGVWLAEVPDELATFEIGGPFGTSGSLVITPGGRFNASLHN